MTIDLSTLALPTFGDKASGLTFVSQALSLYETALSSYSGKADSKTSAKVTEVLEAVKDSDPEAVKLADQIMADLRSAILDAMNENPNVAVVLFPELDEVKKAVGSWRDEATVNVETVETDSNDDDRDLVAEYEALSATKTMIEGTFMAWQLDAKDLPAKYRAEASKRVEGADGKTKNVKIPGAWQLKVPGKLTQPNSEGKTSPGKVATSSQFAWVLSDSLGELELPKGVTVTSLARICSTKDAILSFADLKERLDNKDWSKNAVVEVTVPRGKLIGTKVTK